MRQSPDVIITGAMATLWTPAMAPPIVATPHKGSIDVALCGYGSFVPKVSGIILPLVTQSAGMIDPNPNADNAMFEIILFSNRLITPPGTYYTFTVRDANGDIVQINAYQFTTGGTWDLSELTPFDPAFPPPPMPPPVSNEINIVPYSPNPEFDGGDLTAWKITLAGDVTNATLTNIVPGNLYTFIVIQDGTGGHFFGWPEELSNATHVDTRANATTIQTFVADDISHLYAIGPGTVFL